MVKLPHLPLNVSAFFQIREIALGNFQQQSACFKMVELGEGHDNCA